MKFVQLGDTIINFELVTGMEKYEFDGGPAIKVNCVGGDFYRFTLHRQHEAYYALTNFMQHQMEITELKEQ